ncbi:hypothetical protein AJ79_03589 [Helicocarpus griseus UAMH5409]|uniref:F-box domain-containing protein n=1 Tax=Helicocarpus griseus UAMH5409 TaxID=1447875 RepID=A0A2B7XWL7_9EURO|nr:hypothetical protein AJ79_03589 [Helicocarpus griseus UAMH5409]
MLWELSDTAGASSDPMDLATPVNAFLHAYRALPSSDARQQLLETLITQLNTEDCPLVNSLSYARLHVDFLDRLPTELAAEVASYLPLWDIFLYRSVSKRWKEVLSSPLVCSRSFYAYFYQHLDTLDPAWQIPFRRTAKCRRALLTGKPYSKAFIPIDDENLEIIPHRDNNIVLRPSMETIQLFSLVDGPIATFQTENRESIDMAFISETAVAALTLTGYCYVWNYKSGQNGGFRLPSLGPFHDTVFLDEDVVVLWSRTLIIWDLKSRQAREIKRDFRPMDIFLNAKEGLLVLIDLVDARGMLINGHINRGPLTESERDFSGIVGTRYLLQGTAPVLFDRITYFMAPPNQPTLWKGRADSYSTKDLCIVDIEQSTSKEDRDPCVESGRRRYMMFISHPQTLLRNPSIRIYRDLHSPPPFDSAIIDVALVGACPDVMYFYMDTGDIDILDYSGGTRTRSETWVIEQCMGATERGTSSHSFGDSKFCGIRTEHGIHIWCFDEDIALANEVQDYRRIRSYTAQKRSGIRKEVQRVRTSSPPNRNVHENWEVKI